MKLLVLGGTQFVGRHVVDAALERGHEVTLFNRGQSHPELFPGVTRLVGDRDGDLAALEAGTWDAVVDTSGYVPRVVRQSAELLAGRVRRYLFVSSISVYANVSEPGVDEDAPVAQLEEETEEHRGPAYGPLKALSEDVVREVYGDRATIVRPGLIVGPWDPTGRFTYWPVRIAAGGDVLAPEPRDQAVQVIDGRDLAEFMVRLLEDDVAGTFNVTGPEEPLTLEQVLTTCPGEARLHWTSAEWLIEQGVQPWMELPLWLGDDPEYGGFSRVDVSRAIQAGLTFRPLERTIRDTLEWQRSGEAPIDPPAGMERDREQELLAQR